MAEFINTIDALGDDAVVDSIINRTITEFKDNLIEKVGCYVFYACHSLTVVDVPNATFIDNYAFGNCSALESFAFTNVQTINNQAFYGCSSLKEICCPLVTNALWYTFQKCTNLEKADFALVTSLGAEVFVDCLLTALILRSSTVCTLGNTNAFLRTSIASGTGYIYVPSALVDSYKAATNWSTYADQFRALEDYTVDGTTTGELDENKI